MRRSPTRALALRVAVDICNDANVQPNRILIEALADLFEHLATRKDLEDLCGIRT